MNNFGKFKVTVAIALLVLMPLAACAAGGGRDDRQRPQGPPPEAIEACVGMQEGDAVSFKGREDETLTGTCQMVEDQLVAVPEGHKARK